METNLPFPQPPQSSKEPEEPSRSVEEQQAPSQQLVLPPAVASASISLSLSNLLSSTTNFLFPSSPKPSPGALSSFPSKLKIPSQISTISLSTYPPRSPRASSRSSALSASPLQSPLRFLTGNPAEPSNSAAARRCTIVWFRSDLRVHDNEALTSASNESLSLLPVYLFDPRDYGKSSSGFDKTGPYRATFLLECVRDLRKNLKARGSDLVVRIGRPETVLPELAKEVGADAVYAHQEVSHDEVKAEDRMSKAMEEEGVEVKYFWGSTLYHLEDLPFELNQMPSNYGEFRARVQGLSTRKTIDALDQIKGLPSRGNVEAGEIPSLVDLGLNPSSTMSKDGKPSVNACLVGGETEALDRVKKFAAECKSQPNKDTNRESIYGANFSCKISPWLATGCLSPRFMFDELKKTASRVISGPSSKASGVSADNKMNWLLFELLWRDFFRFITKKYSSGKGKIDAVPVAACA